MEPIETATEPVDQQPVDQAPASPPSPAPDAAERANTAPAQTTAREAFERLAKGEKPEDVNKALYSAQPKQQPATGTSPAAPSNPRQQPAAPKQPADPPADPREGAITPDDLAVLKRAKFDLAAWQHIPPSNRKAVVATLKASQSEADRQFQQARSGRDPGAGQPQPGQQHGRQDEGTPPADQAPEETDEQQLPTRQGRQPSSQQQQPPNAAQQPADPLAAIDVNSLIDPADLETLRTLGGDDLAETHKRGIARAVGYMQQQMAPMMGMVNTLATQWEESEFNQAVGELKKQPGLENLTAEQTTALRQKANLLIRAAGDLQNYRHSEAVKDAAAALFQKDVQTAAQARLLQSRQASLRGSPERGTGRAPADRPLSGKDRDRAIFSKLTEGMSPDEARRAIDGR